MQLDLVRRPAGLPVQALTGRNPKGVEQVQNLHRKGFHTEELPLAKQISRRIVSEEVPVLESDGSFFRPAEDIYEGLLGSEGSQRCALLETFMELGEEEGKSKEYDHEIVKGGPLQSGSMPGLVQLTAEISERASQVATWAPNILDFQVTSRSPFMLLEAGQTRGDKPKPPKLSSDAILKWIHIFQRHRFMMLVCLGPEPGSLELRPLTEDAGTHRLQLRPGAFVLLRADCLTHRFSSRGKCFMLTSFLLGPNPQRNARLASHLQDQLGRNLLTIKENSKSEEDFESQTSRAIQRIANQNLHKGQQTAVRGCAAREPVAAHDPDAFCSGIMAGIDGAQIIPHLRWDHEQYFVPDPSRDPAGNWKTHCNHGCFIEGLELFDNKMFKISPMEATGMDPNQRQALEVFYETTMSAGLDEKKLMRSNIGVFMGGPGGFSEYSQVPKDEVGGALGSTSGSAAIMANRISFCMGIHGPNFFIDLEGAASLTAFNLAVDSVQRDKAQCIAAVALGVDCNVHPQGLLTLGWAGLLSKKGRCLSFDSYADGYIRGEGYTGLYVNPLMKEHEGKKIIDEEPAIIALASGTFINNNGSAASLTAPSGAMYQELVANCVRSADISPLDVDAVECQAAGNILNDAVEATALTRAYRSLAMNQDAEEEMLGLMAAKTNVGNMRPAMGCAALLRVIVGQAMGCMPPSLHMHKMNPHVVAADDVPSFFVTEPVHHRMVSAFVACTASGIGGSNAHTILWGKACIRQNKMEKPVQAEDVLTFWPGGGGDLDPLCEPRRGLAVVMRPLHFGSRKDFEKANLRLLLVKTFVSHLLRQDHENMDRPGRDDSFRNMALDNDTNSTDEWQKEDSLEDYPYLRTVSMSCPFFTVATYLVCLYHTVLHLRQLSWWKRGKPHEEHTFETHDRTLRILILPLFYGVMSCQGVVRMWGISVNNSADSHHFKSFGRRKQFLQDSYDASFWLGDLYESYALFTFGLIVLEYLSQRLRRGMLNAHDMIKTNTIPKPDSFTEMSDSFRVLLGQTKGLTILGIKLFCATCAGQAIYGVSLNCAAYYHFKESIFGTGCHTQQPGMLQTEKVRQMVHYLFYGAGFIASFAAIENLVEVERGFRAHLHEFRPIWKFLGTKIIVTIAFLQSMALAACPPFCWWSYTRANLLYASLLCIECFLISILHLYAWSADESWFSVYTPLTDERALNEG